MVFGILLATGLFYLLFADGEVQPWNNPQNLQTKSTESETTEVDLNKTLARNF